MFVIAGLAIFCLWRVLGAVVKPMLEIGDVEAAAAIMIATFGVFHLLHGAGVLLCKRGGEEV